MTTPKNAMRPVHPGEVLLEEYLKPMDLSANALAQALGVPANRISAIVSGERGVTADTALRLARALNTTPQFWMNLQQTYELREAERSKETIAALKEVRRLVHG
jgi:addiction module HigA family antidote